MRHPFVFGLLDQFVGHPSIRSKLSGQSTFARGKVVFGLEIIVVVAGTAIGVLVVFEMYSTHSISIGSLVGMGAGQCNSQWCRCIALGTTLECFNCQL